MRLSDEVKTIKGIGEKTSGLFAKLSVNTVGELLTFYPRRYECFADPVDILKLKEGEIGSVCGLVIKVVEPKYNSRVKVVTATVKDSSGEIDLIWFNQPFVKYELKPGYHFIFRGKVVKKGRRLQMEQAKIYKREDYARLKTSLQPVYSLTSGLSNNLVTKSMKQALVIAEDFPEFIPTSVRKEYSLIKKRYALEEVHFPKNFETLNEARRSLIFEEFFLFSVVLKNMNMLRHRENDAPVIRKTDDADRLIDSLPFTLTADQMSAFQDIKKDLASGRRMTRLIQGDVGSGKTIVAALSLLITAASGFQGAIMVPTEVLARQHFETLQELLSPFNINVVLLSGASTAKKKREAKAALLSGEAQVAVGTHALFQNSVEFKNLALCITDEQHRFGVEQREKLHEKAEKTHILAMSATPIPRTLAMMMYADMDISKINSKPSERLPIKNCVVGPEYRETAYKFIRGQVESGHQAYIICPMIDENEGNDLENVTDYSKMLQDYYGEKIRVGMLHGRMKNDKKNEVMENFAKGEIDVLVSTTVVEVGVNVPNATVMMIENAERFGLAQLHQLRGRVGRGKDQSYCIISHGECGEDSIERLNVLKNSTDGFFIANEDLRLRGPGDLFGTRQCGEMYFKIGDIYYDAKIFGESYEAAGKLTSKELDSIVSKLLDAEANFAFKFMEKYCNI